MKQDWKKQYDDMKEQRDFLRDQVAALYYREDLKTLKSMQDNLGEILDLLDSQWGDEEDFGD